MRVCNHICTILYKRNNYTQALVKKKKKKKQPDELIRTDPKGLTSALKYSHLLATVKTFVNIWTHFAVKFKLCLKGRS